MAVEPMVDAYKVMLEGHGDHAMEKMFLSVQELLQARRECPQEYVAACAKSLGASNALIDAALVGYTAASTWARENGFDIDLQLAQRLHDEQHQRAIAKPSPAQPSSDRPSAKDKYKVVFSVSEDAKREEAWMYVDDEPCVLLSFLAYAVVNSDPHVAASWRGLMVMGGESSWKQFCKDTGMTP